MRKVLKDFFCIEEKKNYKEGENYTGKRTDIEYLLEPKKKTKVLKQDIKQKPAPKTK